MDLILRLSIIFFSISIILLSIITTLFRLFKKKLIRYPDQFYYYSLWAQLLCGVFFLTFLFVGEYSKTSLKTLKSLYFICVFFYLVYFHYIVLLNIEIYKKLSKSLTKCSTRLINIYHFIVFLSSLTLTLICYYLVDFDEVKTKYQLYYMIHLYYMTFLSLIIWLCTFYIIRNNLWTDYKNLLNLFIASFFITISIFAETIMQLVQTKDTSARIYYMKSQILLLSFNGILQGLAIFSNKNFRKTIRQLLSMKKLSESILNSEGTESPSQDIKKNNITLNSGLLSDLFDNITKTVNFKQTLVKILISSSLFFSKSPSEANEKHYSLNIQDFSSPDPSINLLLDKSNKNLARSPTLTLKQYNPRIFNYIKSLSPSTSNEVILSSLKDPKNYSKLMSLAFEEGGRSSSFVFLTSDEKFIIKTIKKHERKLFIEKILHVYSDRIASGKSRLARILGTFELVELKKSFIIMENILHNKDLSYIFDLKGSKVDRMIKGIPDPRDPPTGLVLKDVNFDLLNYKLKLKVTENQEILVSLIEDFTLLKKMGIMDYSILLGICVECTPSICTNRYSYVNDDGYIISVGIIDFFQEYSFGKVGEKTVKSVFNKSEEISSASPEEYFKRIVKMAADIFK